MTHARDLQEFPSPRLRPRTADRFPFERRRDFDEDNLATAHRHDDLRDLAANTDATVFELENVNHLFQTAETGAAFEYGRIEETFSPAALDLIADWILEHS